jgi:hypothetical protein
MKSDEGRSQKDQESRKESSSFGKPIQELKEKVTNGLKDKVQKTIEENVNQVAEKATEKTINKLEGSGSSGGKGGS